MISSINDFQVKKVQPFLIRYEKWLPIFLFFLFCIVTIPGISWGTPSLWNPDELVWRVIKSLDGELKFDETEPDYNYPSLPKYAMYGVGWLVRQLGGSPSDVIVSARLISVILGGLTVVMIYFLAKMASKNIYIRLLAPFFALSNTALVHNARFAHNDLYLLFFITLALFAIVKYRLTQQRLWVYLAFFSSGCAASSKYTGVSFVVVLLVLYLMTNWKELHERWLQMAETLFIALTLTVIGYVVGTPKALLWMSFYFKRMIPAALRFASYGRGPDSLIGLLGQWGTFREAVGGIVYYIFLVAFLYFFIRYGLFAFKKITDDPRRMNLILTLIVAILIFDIPFLFSYNYVPRFFLPFLPMFSLLGALFVEDVTEFLKRRHYQAIIPWLCGVIVFVIGFSFLNVVGVALLFSNDARTPAAKFIATLPSNSNIEYTLYPPTIPENYFDSAHNYPIYFIKYPGETVPTNKSYQYNLGEKGLYQRHVNYLVIDSFTYARFSDTYICQTNPVECKFFKDLLAGKTDLRLIASFEYSLPPYLPQISISSVNPDVKIYEVPERQ
jgi:hypothetical protein